MAPPLPSPSIERRGDGCSRECTMMHGGSLLVPLQLSSLHLLLVSFVPRVTAMAILVILLASTSAIVAPTSATAILPPTNAVTVSNVSYAGSGCPPGSAEFAIDPDGSTFTIIFSAYEAYVSPSNGTTSAPVTTRRANCQLLLSLRYPAGFSFTMTNITYRGYAFLEPRVTGKQVVTYYFAGSSRSVRVVSNFRGPMDDNYVVTDAFDLIVRSPCKGRTGLVVNTELRVSNTNNREGMGLMTTDSIDGVFTTVYSLTWNRCTS